MVRHFIYFMLKVKRVRANSRLLAMFHVSVSKTNLAVHEDKNRVPFVKVPKLQYSRYMRYEYYSNTNTTVILILQF